MAGANEFIDYLVDNLQPLGDVTARAMFGGHGIFTGGRMFALVADQTLYFKADETSMPIFDRRHLEPFMYPVKGELRAMSYRKAPEESLEDPEVLLEWARLAIDAALRAANRRKNK